MLCILLLLFALIAMAGFVAYNLIAGPTAQLK